MSKNHKNLTLPLHHSPASIRGPVDESNVQLRVGGSKSSTWGAFGRALAFATLGVVLFYASLSAWAHFALGHLGGTPTFASMLLADNSCNDDHLPKMTSNRSFPLDLSKALHIDVSGCHTVVIVSETEGDDEEQAKGGIRLESTWYNHESEVAFDSSNHDARLTVKGSASTVHTVHIDMPSDSTVLPNIHLCAERLSLDVGDITFGNLIVDIDEVVDLPSEVKVQDDLEMRVLVGDISGTYTFARRLALRTRTGKINAGVHILHPDSHGHDSSTPPPTVDARADAGSVHIEVLSQAKGVESSIIGMTEMGTVDITHVPEFQGGFEANVDLGSIKISTHEHKALHITERDDTHVRGYVELQAQVEYTVKSHGDEMPSPVHCPPHCAPDIMEAHVNQAEPCMSIQTDPAHQEPTVTIANVDQQAEPRMTVQTDPPYPTQWFTIVNDQAQPRMSIQTDAPHPEPTFTIATLDSSPQETDTWRDPRGPMPTVRPVPPPPMRSKWGKHCPPICPPGVEVEEQAVEAESNDDQHYSGGSWPDHCEAPLCFVKSEESEGSASEEEVEYGQPNKRDGGLPKGGSVKAWTHFGSIELKL